MIKQNLKKKKKKNKIIKKKKYFGLNYSYPNIIKERNANFIYSILNI